MTQAQVQALKVGDPAGYQSAPDAPIVPGIVTQNGPRLDPEGNPITFMNDLLVISLNNSSYTVSWEPVNYPTGIPQLVELAATS